MRKGKNRRYREARQFKHTENSDITLVAFVDESSPTAGQEPLCDECSRSPHADWCMAEEA